MTLNVRAVAAAMRAGGVSQSDVAKELDVSREAVSKWLKGDATPRPNRVLKLARLLGLEFDQIYEQLEVAEPVVAFRRKGSAKTTEKHYERAKDMGYLLNPLVEHLPFDLLSYPAAFVSPSSDYSYVRRAAAEVRRRMSLSSQVVEFDDIIEFFGEAHAVLIPVMRGNLRQHENALRVYLPDSRTTWVFINLDSKIMDFKFWMAHELAHVKAPEMPLYEAESFADRFAAELLFPVEIARSFVDSINATVEPGIVVTRVQNLAREFAISPVTVLEQLNLALDAKELPPIEVNIHPSTTNFHKSFRDVNEIVFGTERPTPSDYARICTEVFQTPIFDVLARYLRESGKEASYLQRVLNIGALDAKNLHKALTSDHGRKNPA